MSEKLSPLPIVFCFAGQGSQYHHMAADFLKNHPIFRKWMGVGDGIIQRNRRFSPIEKIYDPDRSKSDPFNHLEHSHPSLFITQFAVAKMLQHEGIRPNVLFGISLGEFVGMSVSGMITFQDALLQVARQPTVFQNTAPAGHLIAALAGKDDLRSTDILLKSCEIVGVNSARHSVLACLQSSLGPVKSELHRLDIAFQELPVPFAFHSRWIEPARENYFQSVIDLSFDTPFWPLWSCRYASRMESADRATLWEIVRGPMNVQATIDAMEAEGGAHYIDLSPTGSIAAILGQGLPKTSPSTANAVLSPFGGDMDRLESLVQLFTRETYSS